jgi:hypothetical protein
MNRRFISKTLTPGHDVAGLMKQGTQMQFVFLGIPGFAWSG